MTIIPIMQTAPNHWKMPKGDFSQKTVVTTADSGSRQPSRLVSFGDSEFRLSM
ncbi:hypothetical protein D3C72_2141740 [compost metagenome]